MSLNESYLNRKKLLKTIEIRTKKIVNNFFAGEYHSVFKGQGVQFDELREYQVGDDIRYIDWNVTAKLNTPFIKKFNEERELTVVIIADISSSLSTGSGFKLKSNTLAEVAALFAYSTLKNNDKSGLLLFSDYIEKHIPPGKGFNHFLNIVNEILIFQSGKKNTNLKNALEFFYKAYKKRSIVILLSDFLTEGYKDILKLVSMKHDVIPIVITDFIENVFPKGLINVNDSETGNSILVDSHSKEVKEIINSNINHVNAFRKDVFKSLNLEEITISNNEDYIKPIEKFFMRRLRR